MSSTFSHHPHSISTLVLVTSWFSFPSSTPVIMSHHKHKKSWYQTLLCKKHHHDDEDTGSVGVDDDEEAEETDDIEKSSVTNKEVRQHVAIESQLSIVTTTMVQMAFAGFVEGLLISAITTVIPRVFPVDSPVVAVIGFQAVFVFMASLMMAYTLVHYDADSKLLLMSMVIPLLSSDKKMFGGNFNRKHRVHDLVTAVWTRGLALVALNGGWLGAGALMGWLNKSNSAIGNPVIGYQGVGGYTLYQIYAMIGFGYTLTYFTFGSHKLITSNGHVRKWIDVLKTDEAPQAAAVLTFALMSTLQYMFNMALTGSPLQFELLIAGVVLTQEDDNYDGWFGAQLLGLFIAFLLLFFDHHSWGYYSRKSRHAKVKE